MRTRKNILLKVVCVLLVLCLIGAVVFIFKYKESKDGEIARLNNLIYLTNENNIIIPKNDFVEYAKRYESIIRFSQKYHPEHFVYYGYQGVEFAEIDNNITTTPFGMDENEDNFTFVDNRLVYKDDTGFVSSTGIDVSEHQGYIDWNEVGKDGIEYAFVRVGYRGYASGTIYLDGHFHDNMSGANDAGVPVGVYFFSGAKNEKEAVAEADYVLSQISDYDVDLEIAFDMEDVSGSDNRMKDLTVEERVAITKAFCDRIIEKGHKPLVYGNAKWFMERLELSEVIQYGVWYANWDYYTWPYDVSYYQYTDGGKVEGIETSVDLNISFKGYQQ